MHKILKGSSLIGPSKQSGYSMGAKVLQRVLQGHCVSLKLISFPVLTATQEDQVESSHSVIPAWLPRI